MTIQSVIQLLTIQSVIQQQLISKFSAVENIRFQPVGGGSINETFQVSFSKKSIFCKINSATKFPHLFQKEKHGLEIIAQQNLIKTPAVIDCFTIESNQFLLLEWVQEGYRTENFWISFGEKLAALHQVTSEYYGLSEDNYMGSVPQQNLQHKTWSEFFAWERLSPMMKRCAEKNLLTKKDLSLLENLMRKLTEIFEEEKPSLLHGDLWSGNFMCNHASEPVLIDPAVYYGHRSMDLAMTTLFGGFNSLFYQAYNYHFPFPANYQEQWAACNLYPLLIHLYLFGSGYLPQIQNTLKQFA